MSYLKIEQLSKHFGGIVAVNDVSLEVQSGTRHAIIGPNGAGKSTFFNLISGTLSPTKGQIYLDGRTLTPLSVHQRANLGIGRTFQRHNLFMELTVFENVRLVVQHRQRINSHWFRAITTFGQVRDEAEAILERVGLLSERDRLVSSLAYGQQRALEIAIALATEPKILLLDEPTAGMSPAETIEMTTLMQKLPDSLTLMIVEHDMDVIFSLAEQITVLHYGEVIRHGSPEEIRHDAKVQEIYLGMFRQNL